MAGAGLDTTGWLVPDGATWLPVVRLPPPTTLEAPLVAPDAVAEEPLTDPLAVAVAGAEAVLEFVEGAVAGDGAGTTTAAAGGTWVLGAGGGAGVAGVP